jgi:hypothetical protein
LNPQRVQTNGTSTSSAIGRSAGRASVVCVLCLLLIGGTSAAPPAEATAVAILRAGSAVYVAVDSKRTFSNGLDGDACKIRDYDGLLFVASGLNEVIESNFSLDLSVARATVTWSGTIEEKADHLAHAVARELLIAAPAWLAADWLDQPALRFALAGVENGGVIVAVRAVVPRLQNGRVGMDVQNLAFPGLLLLGMSTAFAQQAPLQRLALAAVEPAEHVRTLVQAEIDATPALVGPPISVVGITPDGYAWIDRSRTCGG